MRLLSKRQVKELVTYSFSTIDRLEAAGNFPKRVPLGLNRVGWVENEIVVWIETKISERDNPTDTP